MAFRVDANDAPLFERLLPLFSAHSLQNQPNRRSVMQMMAQGERLKPFTASMYPPHR